jgi:hypothetical protein
MPGPFTHIYAARRVADLLSEGVTEQFVRDGDGELSEEQLLDERLAAEFGPARCAEIMGRWPKFTALGAVGPDLFFFMQDYKQPFVPCDEIMLAMSILYYLDDQGRLDDPFDGLLTILATVSNTWAGILRLILKLKKAWDAFVKVWDETVGAILDAAGQVVDDLTGGLYSEIGDAISQLGKDLIAIAAEELLTSADVFGFFSLGMREGFDEQAFLWSDMTHYRRTSQMPRRLMAHARALLASADETEHRHGEQLLAYALGWVCHVGTDTVAHGFVNEQAGGPFRTHWQRHHLVENHLDASNYENTGSGELPADDFIGVIPTYESLNNSALYFALQIPQDIDNLSDDEQQGDLRRPLPEAVDRASRREREELLDTDGALPAWFAETIVKVLIEVYARPGEPPEGEGGLPNLDEAGTAHPRNLLGEAFQDGLHTTTGLLGKWLDALGIDRSDIALDELREAVAPDHDPSFRVPEGFPLPWEVQATYRFMLSWFKRSYVSSLDLDKPQRPTVFTPPASDFDFGPPDFSGVNAADDPISEACEVVAALLDWLWKTLTQAAQAAYDIGKSIISAVTWPARDEIYKKILLPAWQVGENVRMVLGHLGYLMPASEERYATGEIRHPNEIDSELITLGHTVNGAFAQALAASFDVLGNLDDDPALLGGTVRNPKSGDFPWLPVRGGGSTPLQTFVGVAKPTDVVEFRRPWAYPDRTNDPDPKRAGNRIETPRTVAGPYPRDATPDVLIGVDGPASNELRAIYQRAGCPEDTDRYNEQYIGHRPLTNGYGGGEGEEVGGTNPLGDPVVFSSYLIGQIAHNPGFTTSFNLDADRGFGYLCWDWIRNLEEPKQSDPRGHRYPPPAVRPEGTADRDDATDPHHWQMDAPTAAGQEPAPEHQPPLQLHYPGRECVEPGPIG